MLFDGVDQGGRLKAVAAGVGAGLLLDFAGVDGGLDTAHNQAGTQMLHKVVPKLQSFWKVVACVDVHQRHGDATRGERFGCQMGHHNAVLPP